MKGRAKARLAFPQARLAGPQLRFGSLPIGNVQPESQHVRHAVELDHFGGQEHREQFSAVIAEAALARANGPGATQFRPIRFAIFLALPHAELGRVPAQNLLAAVPRPSHKRVIDEHKLPIAHARDAKEDRAGLESHAKPRLAFGQRGLGAIALDAQRDVVRD